MILLDTSGVLACLDQSSRQGDSARRVLERDTGPLVLSPFVLAELDYLVAQRFGVSAELRLLAEVAGGAYVLAPFDVDDVAVARSVVERRRDLAIGLADSSIVVLAGRYRTERVLTLDERHFRLLRAPNGRPFTILPADDS